MSENSKTPYLFAEFPPVTTAEWEAVINKDLKGKDYEKTLIWRTLEGFNAKPYYRAEDLANLKHLGSFPGEFPYVRGNNANSNNWLVRQNIEAKDLAAANKKALDVLGKGIESLGFVLDSEKDITAADLEVLLQGICLPAVEINFSSVKGSLGLLKELKAYLKKHSYDFATVRGSIDADPARDLSLKGKFCCKNQESYECIKNLVVEGQDLPLFRTVSVNAEIFGNSGSSCSQELAFGLAAGAEILSRLTEMGLSVDQIAPKIKFNFSIGSNYFLEISKLRAARLLWSKVVEAYQPASLASAKMYIYSSTSLYNKSVYDPAANMLRTTTEAMSAAIGGAESISVLAYDATFQTPTETTERIARNQQLLLKEESYFDKIVDPAGGSYYIESLTDSISKEAWKLFLATQEKGGYIEAFKAGFVQAQLAEVANKRKQNIATRREILLGTNQYPNFTESIEVELPASVFAPVDLTAADATVETLKPFRAGQAFEALRYKTELAARNGKRPVVCMLPVGSLAMRLARSQFSCNFFACAGFKVVDFNGFETVAEGVKVVLEKNPDIVVICSSDDEYATLAPEAAELLKGKAILVVAGAPACSEDLKAKGITNFISVKNNVLETLKGYQAELGL